MGSWDLGIVIACGAIVVVLLVGFGVVWCEAIVVCSGCIYGSIDMRVVEGTLGRRVLCLMELMLAFMRRLPVPVQTRG